MQTWSLKALQGHDAPPASISGSQRQGMISRGAVQEVRPHTGRACSICWAQQRQEAMLSSLLHRVTVSNFEGLQKFCQEEGVHLLEVHRFKNNIHQWFYLFPESVSSTNMN